MSLSTTTKGGASTAAVAAPPVVDTRSETIIVAASNSLDPTKADAAYRCTGVNDEVEMNAALTAAAAVNGSVELLEGDYNTVLTLSVAVNVTLKAVGWGAVIHFNAGGAAITIAGDNVKLRDFKVVIVAGAGEAGTRPNCIYAEGRTNLEIVGCWVIGDETVGDDGSSVRQSGIVFSTVTFSKIINCVSEDNVRQGIYLLTSTDNIIGLNTCRSNINRGIYLYTDSDRNIIQGNTCTENEYSGIYLSGTSIYNVLTGNTCNGNTMNGIYVLPQHNVIVGNSCQGNVSDGISLNDDYNTVSGNVCQGNGGRGIRAYASDYCAITGNTCQGNDDDGIFLGEADYCTVAGNVCQGSITDHGIELDWSFDNVVVGNTCQGNNDNGIYTHFDASRNTITGNICKGNTYHGIYLRDAVSCAVTGNVCHGNLRNGIRLDDALNNTVTGNTCCENDVDNTATYNGIMVEGDSVDNLIAWNVCNDNDNYGISINAATCSRNWVKNNQLRGNTSGPFNDLGTDTKLAVKVFQFIQGTTFISADGSAKGWEINAEADMAVALGQLPAEVQQVVRLKIGAVALGAPVGAGGHMHLDILFNAGGSLEAYNLAANSWTLANFDSEEADYVNTDVIHWVVEDGDVGNEISNLLGGDILELKVNGGTADDPDGATNATFRVVEYEYV